MKKLIIAPDSFKDSLSNQQAAEIIHQAFLRVKPNYNYKIIPISDGGEGLIASLTSELKSFQVKGPIGKNIKAEVGFLNEGKTAIVEMAKASGLELVEKEKRNPLFTTSYGVGELILNVLNLNVEKIILGLGGSATNDLGLGALTALGIKFLNKEDKSVGIYGKDLLTVKEVDITNLNQRILNKEIIIAVDVNNPLSGKTGASYVYGPQKGLKKADLKIFDDAFKRVSKLLNQKFNCNYTKTPGSGAAGGLGYAFMTIANAEVKRGFDVVYETLNLADKLIEADFLITGEGKIDVYAFTGKKDKLKTLDPFTEIIEITKPHETLKEALKNAKENLFEAALKHTKRIL